MSLDLAKYTNCHIRASVSVFIDSEKLSHWSSKCLCNWQNTQIFALEPQVFLYFLNFSVFSVFLHWSKCFCIYRPDRSRLFAFKGEREVVLHNRETEFRTNKQQRGANLNKVTELEHKKSAPWKLSFSLHSEIFLRPCPRARSQRGWRASRGTSSASFSSSFFLLLLKRKVEISSLFFPFVRF